MGVLEKMSGVLVDTQIRKCAEANELITGDFDPEFVRQACYELRASDVFYETAREPDKRRTETGGEAFLLRPHCYVTVIVKERIELPSNVVARILTKGQLFSIGIQPVNTYADPGFSGRLGVTLYNASRSYVLIRPGSAIAKIEFEVLATKVAKPYTGQHGYETKIWPVPDGYVASRDDLSRREVDPSSREEIARAYGEVVADINDRLDFYQRRVWIQLAASVGIVFLLLTLLGPESWGVAVVLSVAGNFVTSFFQGWWYAHRRDARLEVSAASRGK